MFWKSQVQKLIRNEKYQISGERNMILLSKNWKWYERLYFGNKSFSSGESHKRQFKYRLYKKLRVSALVWCSGWKSILISIFLLKIHFLFHSVYFTQLPPTILEELKQRTPIKLCFSIWELLILRCSCYVTFPWNFTYIILVLKSIIKFLVCPNLSL